MSMELMDIGIFHLTEMAEGRLPFWSDALEVHDTHGLPFDLMYVKMKESTDKIPPEMTSENFQMFMTNVRKHLQLREAAEADRSLRIY